MNITIACHFPAAARTPFQVWEDVVGITSSLSNADPLFANWWAAPRLSSDAYVPVGEGDDLVARVQEDDIKLAKEYPGQPSIGSNGALLTNAGNDKDWLRRGGVGLSYMPALGMLRLHVDRIEKVFDSPVSVLESTLSVLLNSLPITFAKTNVQQLVEGELLLYSVDRAPFPHREFLGWMGYVDASLTQDQVPAAARLERRGGGTLILATEVLDLADAHAIKQANQVEMSLVDLGLLPVTDPLLG
ncbi:TPA: immunity 52 family protein [Stenotrophomonas maltophilia]|nr:immunity 52 family protein [Stenotrophomonas maltophilia]